MSNVKVREFWTKKEVKFLRNNWSIMTGSQIAEELGRKKSAVYSKAVNLGLRKNIKHKVSTPKSLKKIEVNKGVQKKLTFSSTEPVVKEVKKCSRTPWTPEDEFLKNSFKLLTYEEIGKKLGRTKLAISDRMRKNKLQKLLRRPKQVAVSTNKPEVKPITTSVVKTEKHISVQIVTLAVATLLNVGLAALVIYLLLIAR